MKLFACVGSRPYPFNRLFEELDRLCENATITSELFAQIGASTYVPKHYPYQAFLDPDEYRARMAQADIVITHGASGSIMSALHEGKKVIAVTRLARYGEHINDHQVGINETLADAKLVLAVFDMADLGDAIRTMEQGDAELVAWHNENPLAIVDAIDRFIQDEILSDGVDARA